VILSIMAIGTVANAFIPTHATIGLLVFFLVLIERSLLGFSAGVELGSVYLSETGAPKPHGFLCQLAIGQPASAIVAAIIGYVLNTILSPDEVSEWRPHSLFHRLAHSSVHFRHSSLEETHAILARTIVRAQPGISVGRP
jgi:MFS family permease